MPPSTAATNPSQDILVATPSRLSPTKHPARQFQTYLLDSLESISKIRPGDRLGGVEHVVYLHLTSIILTAFVDGEESAISKTPLAAISSGSQFNFYLMLVNTLK
jgi:hypothetical protein